MAWEQGDELRQVLQESEELSAILKGVLSKFVATTKHSFKFWCLMTLLTLNGAVRDRARQLSK